MTNFEGIPRAPVSRPSTPHLQERGSNNPQPNRALRNVVIAGVFLGILGGCAQQNKAATPPAAPEVTVATVIQQDVPIYDEWVAQLNGPVNAEITPKVQGYLLRQAYKNGFFVKKGQLLFELDPRPYEAARDAAKASLAKAQAEFEKYQDDFTRDTPLAAKNAIPLKQLENDTANRDAAAAAVQAEKAALKNAELNLAWTKVNSPIDGIAGVSSSQVGDLVGMTTKMTTVSQVNPIWVNFNVSESDFLTIAPKITGIIEGKARKDSFSRMPIEFILANDHRYPLKGHFVSVDREIGSKTGTIQVICEFANPDALLRPGGFGRVRVQTAMNKNALLVPQRSVIEVQTDYMVVVVTPDHKARFRPVKVGERVGNNWIITEGLQPGTQIVADGIERIELIAASKPGSAKEGIPVTPKPYMSASAGEGSN